MGRTEESSVDTHLVINGVLRFAEQEVGRIKAGVAELLEDPRRAVDERGRLVPALVEAKREIRQASARAGYYTMFCPEDLGGGGLGSKA